MKILHISTHKKGGAANAAIRIHESLIRRGIDSTFLTLEQSGNFVSNHILYDGVYKNETLEYPVLSFKNYIREKIFNSYEKQLKLNFTSRQRKKFFTETKNNKGEYCFTLFSFPETIYDITSTSAYKEADIIHLHWVASFLDYPSFFNQIDKPILWTLHDENPYLGGFHYQDDVDRNILSHGEKEKELIHLKANSVQKTKKITIVSPSFWIAENARNSFVFNNKRVTTIRYSLDKTIFTPRDQNFSRDLYQLPLDKKIILLASQDLSVPRKGVKFVEKVLASELFNDFLFVVAGQNSQLKGPNVISVGSIRDEQLMSCLYSAADYFLLPSLLDNLPNTLLESLYCGTPVIGFKIGDFEAIFEGNHIGVLVEKEDVEGMIKVLELVKFGYLEFERDDIAKKAHELFSEEKAVESYLKEYNMLLDV